MNVQSAPIYSPVYIPLLNPNEIEGVLVSLDVQNGQHVEKGELLGVIETTKSTGEILSERAGFVVSLGFSKGQPARAGEVLCYLADTPETTPDSDTNTVHSRQSGPSVPKGLKITQPALKLAEQYQIDLSMFPIGPIITEAQVREALSKTEQAGEGPEGLPAIFEDNNLIVFGGGGHGKSVIELIRAAGVYRIAGVVDDGLATGATVLDLPVLGGKAILGKLYQRGARLAINAVGGIGNLKMRLNVFEALEAAGFTCPTIVHPRAFIEASARLSAGVQVFPQAYVGSSTQVGFGTIINSGVIVSHDCKLGEFTNLSPGAILAGAVHIGNRSLVGMGVTVNLEVKVGEGARIGNGATVKSDVPAGMIVRAGSIWPG